MMTKSKKWIFAVLIVAAFSMFTLVFANSNQTVSADGDYATEVTATFSTVKYNVKNDGTETLLVAAITEISDLTRVYELGFKAYDGDDPVALAPVSNDYKTHYYTSVNNADSEDLFDVAGKNLIVWKIETPDANVSYAPYIKYGYHNADQLWSYGTERDVESSTKKAVTCYTVTIEADGGLGAPASVTVPSGTPASALNEIAVTKTGYHYDNVWQAYMNDTWTDITGSTLVTGNVTVRPKWVINTYTVNFVTDGGTSIANQTVDYGSTALRPDDPTKAGYQFVCWDTLFSTEITSNTTFTAIWTVKATYGDYTLSFVNKYSNYEHPNANNYDAFTNAVVNDKLVTTTTRSIGNARGSGEGPALTIGGLAANKLYNIDITFTTSGGILCFYNAAGSGTNVNNGTRTFSINVRADANGEAVWQGWYGVENLTVTWDSISVALVTATYGGIDVEFIKVYDGDNFTVSVENDLMVVTTGTGEILGNARNAGNGAQFTVRGLDASSSYTINFSVSVEGNYLVFFYAEPGVNKSGNRTNIFGGDSYNGSFTKATDENGVLTWYAWYMAEATTATFTSVTATKN